MSSGDALKAQWLKYQKEYAYAKEISYEDVLNAVKELSYIYMKEWDEGTGPLSTQ